MYRTGFRPEPDNDKHWIYEDKLKSVMLAQTTGDVDLRPFSSPRRDQGQTGSCFPAGTPILMADYTERPIEDIAVGNTVFTHNGKTRRVTNIFRRPHEEKLYSINVLGFAYPITMTGEHPVFVARNVAQRNFSPGEPGWVKAKDIEPGDYVLMPGNAGGGENKGFKHIRVADYISEEVIEYDELARVAGARLTHAIRAEVVVDPVFARLLGLFLAEGSYRKENGRPNGLNFTFARDEIAYQEFVIYALKTCLGAEAQIQIQKSRPSVTDVRCNNSTVGLFFYALCGEGALKKHVPQVFLEAGQDVRLALLRGWLEGDGTKKKVHIYEYEERPNRVHCTGVTSSEQMHRDLFRLTLLCGLKPSATIRAQESHQNAPARTIVFYSKDVVTIFPEEAARVEEANVKFTEGHRRHREHPWGFLCRVGSIKIEQPEDPIEVYNFEVEGENTYIAGGIAVHNCVAHAVVKALEIKQVMENGGHEAHTDLSRLAVYYLARELMIPQETHIDDGTFVSHACDAIRRFGVCEEKAWPFDPDEVCKPPSWKAMRSAYGHRISSFYKIRSTGQARVDEVVRCLQAGNPVAYGTRIGNNWFSYDGKGVLTLPTDKVGNHATCLVGVRDGKFIGENSWSAGWGDKGFYWLDPKVVAWNESRDFWVIQL